MSIPCFDDIIPDDSHYQAILKIKYEATREGFKLLKLINSKVILADKNDPNSKHRYLQIATTESLTCGLIMATLVDIPWGGYMKYGGFGVYDTDAKRVFNKVSVDDVYTHKCAAEMAIGVLKNSNATLAIAVTGNAMPLNDHVDMLGEVFIGIAGYDQESNIVYITKSINACIDTDNSNMKDICTKWYETIKVYSKYNSRNDTAAISQEIRYYTVMKAYELCIEFINKINPVVPDEIMQRKMINEKKDKNSIHNEIPNNKYNFGGEGICRNDVISERCIITGKREEEETSTFNLNAGKRKKNSKRKKNIIL